MQVEPSWRLALTLTVLVILGAAVARAARLPVSRALIAAAVRATIQLAAVSGLVVLAIQRLWSAGLFVLAMFAIAVATTSGRVGTRRVWWWSALALASGMLPVLAVIFWSRAVPFNGYSLIPIGSIIIGNAMTAHTLAGRRCFAALRENLGVYEATLAVGLPRKRAIWMVLEPVTAEALIPSLDSTRTVGLVTLPGAFIGVLLGGGTPLQAGAAQLLVLIGLVVAQIGTVTVFNQLVAAAQLLPEDLHARLRP